MRSLQLKFTAALLLTSLTAVLVVGLVSRSLMLRKFNQNAMEASFKTFQGDVQKYITTYGSWEQGEKKILFRDWVRNARAAERGPQGADFYSPTPPPIAPPPPQEQGEFARAMPPGAERGERPSSPPERRGPEGRRPRPGGPGGGRGGEVAFRFVVLSPEGLILMGPPDQRYRPAPESWRSQAQPVVVNGQTAVLIVPTAEPNLSQQDHANLAALKEALIKGIAIAMLLAVGLGLFLGHKLGGNLRELTGAIEAVGAGRLRQRVQVHSRDEVGVLAEAFNRMSEELAQTHEKLQQSHAQISEQALRLQELSVRDELTQLHNRRFFDTQTAQHFAQAQRYGRPLTVMIGDIDHFKRINDSFSHAIGDEVLRHVAAILKKFTRQSDIVARYGGEEFVIAFPETPLPQAQALCERLRQQIEAYPWHKIQPSLKVTMSMGLNDDLALKSSEKMVAAADELLYRAKESGRNRVCAPLISSEAMREETLLQPPDGKPPLRIVGPKAA